MARDGEPEAIEALAEAVEEMAEAVAPEPETSPALPEATLPEAENDPAATDSDTLTAILERLDQLIALLTPAATDEDPGDPAAPPLSEELAEVEKQINAEILADAPVTSTEMSLDEAKAMGAMALFGEKYSDRVRVVKAGDYSLELCGGTHVDSTGKLGLFKIISESSVAGGVRRIEAVTGTGVLDYIAGQDRLIADTAAAMKLGNVHELAQKAAAMTAELKEKEKEIAALSAQLTDLKSADLFAEAKPVGAVRLVTAAVENMTADELRGLGDKAKEAGDDLVLVVSCVNGEKGNIAVAAGKAAVAAGANAGRLVKAVSQLAGGNGGGKPDFAMAGAKEIAKLPEALAAAEGLLADMLK